MEDFSAETTRSVAPVPFLREKRILTTGAIVVAADQLTKQIVVRTIKDDSEMVVVVEGFLKFVNWHNTGAAWSIFPDSSIALAILSLVALSALIRFRHHFEIDTNIGKIAMGMLIGGIIGNMIDRFAYQHVIDFIRFYIRRKETGELGYPAFNIADIGICIGVGLLFVMAWREERKKEQNGGEEKKGA